MRFVAILGRLCEIAPSRNIRSPEYIYIDLKINSGKERVRINPKRESTNGMGVPTEGASQNVLLICLTVECSCTLHCVFTCLYSSYYHSPIV